MSVSEKDIAAFQALIDDPACRHVLVLTGAGVSAESGRKTAVIRTMIFVGIEVIEEVFTTYCFCLCGP